MAEETKREKKNRKGRSAIFSATANNNGQPGSETGRTGWTLGRERARLSDYELTTRSQEEKWRIRLTNKLLNKSYSLQ